MAGPSAAGAGADGTVAGDAQAAKTSEATSGRRIIGVGDPGGKRGAVMLRINLRAYVEDRGVVKVPPKAGRWRVSRRGEGRWHGVDGSWAYEVEPVDLEIDGTR